VPLDRVAKIDETASFLNASQWGHIDMLAPFDRKEYPEEAYIRELDGCKDWCIAQASLPFSIIMLVESRPAMVAGGSAIPLVLGLVRIKTTIPSLMTTSINKKSLLPKCSLDQAVWIVRK
jgi:hypothetical protein